MKKILGVIALSLFVGTGAFAQTTTGISSLQGNFDQFSKGVASSLPFASTMGLNWSWSYIGKLPHFGVGASAGFIMLPVSALSNVTSALSIPTNFLPPQLASVAGGLPFPAYTLEGRIGGIGLPFDIGVKYGFIPTQLHNSIDQAFSNAMGVTGAGFDFKLYGAELRYELVKEKFLIPEISIGVGLNHIEGDIALPTNLGFNGTYADPASSGASYSVNMSNPELGFNWRSTSVDAKIQLSKKILLLVTPYVGAGLSYGFSNAGGGLSAQSVTVTHTDASGNTTTLQPGTTQYNDLLTYLKNQGIAFDPAKGLNFGANANGFSARAFAGASINLWFVKVDATLMYNVFSGRIGATVGARAQF